MSNYETQAQYGYHHQRRANVLCGNSVDIKVTECDVAEVKADVVVESAAKEGPCNIVRLWGQIKDCQGNPVPHALLKLVKVVCTTAGKEYQGIAHTVSDCEGFYQFDLCYCDGSECYKILVSKAYTGPEQVIETGGGNCHACTGCGCLGHGQYGPCAQYNPIIVSGETDGAKCECREVPKPCPKPVPKPYPTPYPTPEPCPCSNQQPYLPKAPFPCR